MDYRILLRFFPSRFVWLQVDRGGRVFESKTSKRAFEKRGGGNKGSRKSQDGFRGAMKNF